jgi:hypothetical protein
MIAALSQAVGALAGGMTGTSLAEAAAGSGIAKNSVENNWLSSLEIEQADKERAACARAGGNVQACQAAVTRRMDALNVSREKEWLAYQETVKQEVSAEYMQGALWTKDEYIDQIVSRQAQYWAGSGLTEDRAMFTGYAPARSWITLHAALGRPHLVQLRSSPAQACKFSRTWHKG